MSDDIVPIYLHVPRREIAYVKFIFESYEEVAVCRTLDPMAAIVAVHTVPDFAAQARAVVASLEREGACREIPRPPGEEGDCLGPEPDDAPQGSAGTDDSASSVAGRPTK